MEEVKFNEEELGYLAVLLNEQDTLEKLASHISYGKSVKDVVIDGIEKDENAGVCLLVSYQVDGETEKSSCKLSNFLAFSQYNVNDGKVYLYDSVLNGSYNKFMEKLFGKQYVADKKAFRSANEDYISYIINETRAFENSSSIGDPRIEPEDAI